MTETKILKKHKIRPPRPPSALERYVTDECCAYLQMSPATLFAKIKAAEIRVIREGRRTYIPGSEIIRLSSIDSAA